MFRFWIDPDRTVRLTPQPLCQFDHVIECRNRELAVVLVRPKREPLLRAQRLDLGEREVFGEPASDRLAVNGLRRAAIGNFVAASVVPPISFSCLAMSTPSLVETRSGSMKSAPISAARR